MEQDSCHHESRSLREEMQQRIQYAERHPDELLDWEDVKQELLESRGLKLLNRRLESHHEHPEQVITREALEAKWQTKWNWKP